MGIKSKLKKFLGLKSEYALLTIIGVGPGDSSLLTIAAVEAIKKAKIIAFPISSDDKNSYAFEIVKKYTKFKKKIPIIFPMARRGYEPEQIWSNAADEIVSFLKKDESVALLCLGDTSLFASSSNILNKINNDYPEIITKIIPGISSVSAAAALSNFNLASKGETLLIRECPNSNIELIDLIRESKGNKIVLVFLKVGKRWQWVKDLLKKENIINNCVIALNLGMPDQIIQKISNFDNDFLPYFSLLLIRLNDE